jgi:hypothetical protein
MTHQSQARMQLLDDVRKDAVSAEDIVWCFEDDEICLEIEWPGHTDRYLWDLTDGRYVLPVCEAEQESAWRIRGSQVHSLAPR